MLSTLFRRSSILGIGFLLMTSFLGSHSFAGNSLSNLLAKKNYSEALFVWDKEEEQWKQDKNAYSAINIFGRYSRPERYLAKVSPPPSWLKPEIRFLIERHINNKKVFEYCSFPSRDDLLFNKGGELRVGMHRFPNGVNRVTCMQLDLHGERFPRGWPDLTFVIGDDGENSRGEFYIETTETPPNLEAISNNGMVTEVCGRDAVSDERHCGKVTSFFKNFPGNKWIALVDGLFLLMLE